jgi:hypothetical protein
MAITIKSFTLPVNMTMSETAMLFQTLRNIALYYEAEIELEAQAVMVAAPTLYFRAIDKMIYDCI